MNEEGVKRENVANQRYEFQERSYQGNIYEADWMVTRLQMGCRLPYSKHCSFSGYDFLYVYDGRVH